MKFTKQKTLYKNESFIIKTNPKRPPLEGGQESESQNTCYEYIKSYRNAIDIGARFGGWSREMGVRFEHLYAFEPRPRWLFVYPMNIKMDNVSLYPYGLGAKEETVIMRGNRIVQPGTDEKVLSEKNIQIKTLDSFKLKNIDFIKIDTDGYELQVLQGGKQTILEWKPFICMEMISKEPYNGHIAEAYLLNLGYKKVKQIEINGLYQWEN